MALHRVVNGTVVKMTVQEENELQAEWAINRAKPRAVPHDPMKALENRIIVLETQRTRP